MRLPIILLVILAVFAGCSGSFAQTAGPPQLNLPIVVDLQAPSAIRRAASEALLRKAREQGSIRVFAKLRIDMKPEHVLSARLAQIQSRQLGLLQDKVISNVISLPNIARRAGIKRFKYVPYISFAITAVEAERLLADPDVLSIQEERPAFPALKQSVPFIHADKVWQAGFTGMGMSVAILDTGVAKRHPMLRGKVESEACYSTWDNASGSRPICPGQATELVGAGAAVNCDLPGCEHGTHVAGIAAGSSSVLKGVAPDAKIIAIQIMSVLPGDKIGAWPSDWVRGLERVYALRKKYNIAAVNLSVAFIKQDASGKPIGFANYCDAYYPAVFDIVRMLRAVNIATVAGTGNNGFESAIGAPACVPGVISVGSTLDNANSVSGFSNQSQISKLLAPGSNITSAVPPNGYETLSGTSMATPHVTGALALLRNVRTASVAQLTAALGCTGVPVTHGRVYKVTKPRIDVLRAMNWLLAAKDKLRNYGFGSPTAPSGWMPYPASSTVANWSVNGGQYQLVLTYEASGWLTSTIPDDCSTDYIVTARMRWKPSSYGYRGQRGILFRAQLPATTVLQGYFAGVWPGPNSNFRAGIVGVGFETDHSCWIDNYALDPNAFNVYKVVSRGDRHQFFINNKLICTLVDSSLGSGRVGVAAWTTQTDAYHQFYDDTLYVDWFKVESMNNPPVAATQ